MKKVHLTVNDEEYIYNHYNKQAEEHKLSKLSTMPDVGVRELEIKILKKYISKIKNDKVGKLRILELGCGNGYTISTIAREIDNDYISTDVNSKMIELAEERQLKNVTFDVMSTTNIKYDNNSFDIVFTERCLINLTSWNEQRKALDEIHKVLKPSGSAILIETFDEGWIMLNESRKVLGLEEIKQPWHNLAFKEGLFNKYINKKFINSNQIERNDQNFLSTYYFGARVLYPSLIQNKTELIYNNPFIQYFKELPPVLNYSPLQLRIIEKV